MENEADAASEEVLRFKKGVSDRLRKARFSLKLNQKDMAKAAGSSFGSWQSYEAAKQVPGSQVIAGMVQNGINANWLLTGEGPMLLKELQGQQFDLKTLKIAVKTLEEGLVLAGKEVTSPEGRAELIAAFYEHLVDDTQDATQRSGAVLKLLKLVK